MTLKTGALLKYGPIKMESIALKIPMPMGASEVIAAKSGRFVVDDGYSRMEVAGATAALLTGWVELPEDGFYTSAGIFTCSATEGGSKALFTPIQALIGVVIRLPITTGTFEITMRNNTCDLAAVASNIQGVDLTASSYDPLLIVDGDLENSEWVDVIPNVVNITGLTGVA